MTAAPADFCITARWIATMGGGERLLEHHACVVGDGRILDILPSSAAAERYTPRVMFDRPAHLLIPGMVNARTHLVPASDAAAPAEPGHGLLSIAKMLKGGITCFCDIGYSPHQSAQLAAAQGLRTLIGLPVTERPSAWAESPREYLTAALALRDEYKGHPSVATGFAPLELAAMSDATFRMIGTLADELDAGILAPLHESMAAIEASFERHGARPLARLETLGLLTPALNAAHMVHLNPADLELAQHGGIAVTLCLEADLARQRGLAPIAALHTAGVPLAIGSDGGDQELFTSMKLLNLHSDARLAPWDVLAAATLGGARSLGLDAGIGTLETGKWADLCCVDLGVPPLRPTGDPIRQLVFSGGRDMVSDVWVAGRQLLSEGQFTRLDWAPLAAHFGGEP